MNQVRVSILMPVFNASAFMEECLESIVAQTFGEWELIAVDDQSTDDSRMILEAFAKKDSRIQVAQTQQKGIIPALRTALELSVGAYITRMDADDRMSVGKLEHLYGNAVSAGEGHVALGLVEYFSDTSLGEGYKNYALWLNGLTQRGENLQEIYKECVIPSPCWMLSRDDLMRIGAFDSDRYPEDYDLCFRMARGGLIVIPSEKVVHYWRDHQGRSSRTQEHYADNSFVEIKCHHFLEWSRRKEVPLVLWGAGRRAKKIARTLLDLGAPFSWICNNPRKIGREIYGVQLESTADLENRESGQLIIAVAGDEGQQQIKSQLAQGGEKQEAYFFC